MAFARAPGAELGATSLLYWVQPCPSGPWWPKGLCPSHLLSQAFNCPFEPWQSAGSTSPSRPRAAARAASRSEHPDVKGGAAAGWEVVAPKPRRRSHRRIPSAGAGDSLGLTPRLNPGPRASGMRTEGWWQPSPPQPIPERHHEPATCCSPLQTCQQRSAGPCRDPGSSCQLSLLCTSKLKGKSLGKDSSRGCGEEGSCCSSHREWALPVCTQCSESGPASCPCGSQKEKGTRLLLLLAEELPPAKPLSPG